MWGCRGDLQHYFSASILVFLQRPAEPEAPGADGIFRLGVDATHSLCDANFMPPEVCQHVAGATAAAATRIRVTSESDVWMLGHALFVMFSGGRRPFVDISAAESAALALFGDAPTPAQVAGLFELKHREAPQGGLAPRFDYLDPDTLPAMIDLLSWMLNADRASRPDMEAVVRHPAFWDESRYGFLDLVLKIRIHDVPESVERSLVDEMTTDGSNVVLLRPGTLEAQPTPCSDALTIPVRDLLPLWRSEFLRSTGRLWASASSELGVPLRCVRRPKTPDQLAEVASGFKMSFGSVTETAIGLSLYLRHFAAHVFEFTRPELVTALTTTPYTQSRFSSRFEFIVRHPITGWFWPRLWRSFHARRTDLFTEGMLEVYGLPPLPRGIAIPHAPVAAADIDGGGDDDDDDPADLWLVGLFPAQLGV